MSFWKIKNVCEKKVVNISIYLYTRQDEDKNTSELLCHLGEKKED